MNYSLIVANLVVVEWYFCFDFHFSDCRCWTFFSGICLPFICAYFEQYWCRSFAHFWERIFIILLLSSLSFLNTFDINSLSHSWFANISPDCGLFFCSIVAFVLQNFFFFNAIPYPICLFLLWLLTFWVHIQEASDWYHRDSPLCFLSSFLVLGLSLYSILSLILV